MAKEIEFDLTNMYSNYNIFIIPPSEGITTDKDPSESGWQTNQNSSDSPGPSTSYFNFMECEKSVDYNGIKWFITFRKFVQIDGFSFIISRINDTEDIANESEIAKEIFLKYKEECGVNNITDSTYYILKLFNDKRKMENIAKYSDYIYLENSHKSTLLIKDGIQIHLGLNFDPILTKQISNNIIMLLSLSEIAYYLISIFLVGKDSVMGWDDKYRRAIIDSLWGYRSYLLKCPASQIFPIFFKRKLSIIDNLLDYRQTDLSNKLDRTLKKVHKADEGILILTCFIIVDVLINILKTFETDLKICLIVFVLAAFIYVFILEPFIQDEAG